MKISAIILAAGSSSRLGRAKQLLRFKEKSLLQHSIHKIVEADISPITLVLGANFIPIRDHVLTHFPDIIMVKNSNWKKGMASSIQCGLEAVSANTDAVLFCLADQPLVPSNHIRALKNAYRGNGKIISSIYNDEPGVPAVIPNKYFPELKQLTGQKGAKYLLKKHQADSILIPCLEAAMDIDTEEDYRQMIDTN